MEPFATVSDLVARWRPLDAVEAVQAEVLLGDASQLIRDERRDLTEVSPLTLKAVTCAVVKRAMVVDDESIGVSSLQSTTGPFSDSRSFSNPMGDLYLTKAEKLRLGGGRQRAFMVDLGPEFVDPLDALLDHEVR